MSNSIKYRNIYKMLMYAVDELRDIKLRDTNIDDAQSLNDLYAALLISSMEIVLQQWLTQRYTQIEDSSVRPKGKIDIDKSLSIGSYHRGAIDYKYFKFDIDTIVNRTIKLAIKILLRDSGSLNERNRDGLNILLLRLDGVRDIDPRGIELNNIDTSSLTEAYKAAFYISKMLIEETMISDNGGIKRLVKTEEEERLNYIFEKFVRKYYELKSKEYKKIHVGRSRFNAKETKNTYFNRYETDTTIENHNNNKALIIDTKWRKDILERGKINSTYQMQIEVYVRNYHDIRSDMQLTGILLYAKSTQELDEERLGDEEYHIGKPPFAKIKIQLLDLEKEFEIVTKKLNEIFNEYVLN